ncbi:hypothetical protein K3X48_03035 [Aliiroseovarius crassostreae]|uniref:Uncharacterized protein n=1 Tax=Aliiroseovarius crassostreae TaxID=154981 RepID=A0A9Q9LVK4_9RHOB|nr:hypothetical protein [Aliiroseovarius crassostreae]UWP95986.1 hypothetical protein K3X48_03035 [Aliiroseovarius crassostreae]
MKPFCQRCLVEEKIVKSHAIPNSFFRKLLRGESSGQFIDITTGAEKNLISQNSGAAPLLCEKCEGWFNDCFDKPIDRILDNHLKKSIRHRGVQYVQGSTNCLAGFITSVLWRAAISGNKRYDAMAIDPKLAEFLHSMLISDGTDFFTYGSFYLRRLTSGETNLPSQTFDSMIMPPGVDGGYSGKGVCWKFAGRGFMFAAIFPKLSRTEQNSLDCLSRNKSAFRVRPLAAYNDPDVARILRYGMEKDRLGHSTI